MPILDRILEKACAARKHIVLAEGTEERTVQAAARIIAKGYADVTLVGNAEAIAAVAASHEVDLTGVSIANPATCEKTQTYVEALV